MVNIWTGLLANLAIIAMLMLIWSNLQALGCRLPASLCQILFGLLMGLGAIALMLIPVPVADGVFIDLRVSLLALSGFFGGPVAAGLTALAALAYRGYAGGGGMLAGSLAIVVTALIGVGGNTLTKHRTRNWKDILALASLVSPATLLCLLALPASIRGSVLPLVWLPLGCFIIIATLMGGLAFLSEIKRREANRVNLMYRQVIDALPDCLNVKDMEGKFLFANPATARLMRAATAGDLIGKSDFDFYPAAVAEVFKADEAAVIASGESRVLDQRVGHKDGFRGWLSTLKAPLRDESGAFVGLITHNRDITEKKQLERRLADSQQHFADALANMADGVAMFDAGGVMVFCNEQYREMFPKTADLRVPGRSAREILQASIQRGELQTLPTLAAENWDSCMEDYFYGPKRIQYRLFDGRWIETRTRFTLGGACFIVCSDITQIKDKEAQLIDMNAKLAAAAHTDGLTGLANRRAFDARLGDEIKRLRRSGEPLSLLMIDADFFKAFNDTYGHTAGDDCLRKIASCLAAVAQRGSDLAARYGGEEMAVILPATAGPQALALAEELRRSVRDLAIAHTASDKGVVTVSIGVVTLTGSVELDCEQFVTRADEALYAAKARGRDQVRQWQDRPAGKVVIAGGRGVSP